MLAAGLIVATVHGRVPTPPAGEVTLDIPPGTPFQAVVDTLSDRQVITRSFLFRIYGRLRGLDRSVKAGTYTLPRGARFGEVHTALAEGRVVTLPALFPEGLTLRRMVRRIADAAGTDSASVARFLDDEDLHLRREVPGPGLEGYLFPDTYRFARGVGTERVVSAMIDRYHDYWTPERRERLAESGMSEREVVTLASIIQAEAGNVAEMRTISSVFHNRLRVGMRLQADPTIHYALPPAHRPRLLYAAMDSVADHPYNTYTHAGLPPGPICSPGADALDAALNPADTAYLYFVAARGANRHIFSRSLEEHNAAIRGIRDGSSSG
ncbi:MAG: endolytic transglycosylase MltG [Gemmatimonadota bacterium]|nr:endolytic transglycosylase MltG [Gemmatimonadota bacterium]MDE2984091.1 endolytic transglycosylase MltG [Gemmatimonadota bacterium]